jgi:hypothetical protein
MPLSCRTPSPLRQAGAVRRAVRPA